MLYSEVYAPEQSAHGGVFKVRQFPRQAFGDLADPVLQIDWFEMAGPTFPPHPHAGFSAVTYLFEDSPNGFVNRDSLGNSCLIQPGALHWSRAAGGMIHEEAPIPGKGPVHGLQIFFNLPAEYELDPPGAYGVGVEAVAGSSGEGWRSRVAVQGCALAGVEDALPAPAHIEEVRLDPDADWSRAVPDGWGGLLLVLEGAVAVQGGPLMTAPCGIGLRATTQDEVLAVQTGDAPARMALIMGLRTGQPAFQQGPLILSSPARLRDRIERLGRGEFGQIHAA